VEEHKSRCTVASKSRIQAGVRTFHWWARMGNCGVDREKTGGVNGDVRGGFWMDGTTLCRCPRRRVQVCRDVLPWSGKSGRFKNEKKEQRRAGQREGRGERCKIPARVAEGVVARVVDSGSGQELRRWRHRRAESRSWTSRWIE
jgi:hypothetical protein